MERMKEWEALKLFDEYLDEVFGTVDVAGIEYQTSEVLKLVDETYYNQLFLDWLDSEGIEIEE